jgi:hypothetical protein
VVCVLTCLASFLFCFPKLKDEQMEFFKFLRKASLYIIKTLLFYLLLLYPFSGQSPLLMKVDKWFHHWFFFAFRVPVMIVWSLWEILLQYLFLPTINPYFLNFIHHHQSCLLFTSNQFWVTFPPSVGKSNSVLTSTSQF